MILSRFGRATSSPQFPSLAAHRFRKVGERSCVIRLRARYGSNGAVIAGGDNSMRIRAKARAIDRCTMHEQHSKILADRGELGEAYQNRIRWRSIRASHDRDLRAGSAPIRRRQLVDRVDIFAPG
jgi:hypothetical protein